MARRGKLTGTHGRLGPWEMWMAGSVLERERETEKEKKVSAGTPWWLGWKKAPGANLVSGLVPSRLGWDRRRDSTAIPSSALAGRGVRVAGPCVYMGT